MSKHTNCKKIIRYMLMLVVVGIVSIFINTENAYAAPSLEKQINALQLVPGTTGNAVLDFQANQIISAITTSKMSNYQKLRACYDYLVTYGVPDSMAGLYYDASALGTCDSEMADAYGMLTTMRGDCYCFSDAFIALTKVMGFSTYGVRGVTKKSGGGYTNHGWAAVAVNGYEYIFDPQIEAKVASRNKGKNSHCRFAKRYKDVPGSYMQYDNVAMNALFGPADYHPWLLYTVIQATPCDQSYDNRQVIYF